MEFQSTINAILITAGSVVAIWFLYKTKAVSVYKTAVDAYEVRLKQLENGLKTIKAENKDLNALVNQLKGENKALKDIVVKPDSEFKETVKVILEEIKDISLHQQNLREDFLNHSLEDDRRFTDIGKNAKSNNDMLKEIIEKNGGCKS